MNQTGENLSSLKELYGISEGDEEIGNLLKENWKKMVKTKVHPYVLEQLCEKAA